MGSTVRHRDVHFDWPASFPVAWVPLNPEFSTCANAISLMMPHVEPYVAKSIRGVNDQLEDPELAAEAAAFVRQELGHHRQHRRFNEGVVASCPALGRVDSAMRRTYGWMWKRWGTRYGVAHAAAAETFAYAAARWVERRTALFTGGDPAISSMFLWHLAEEVEHKDVAFDVYAAVDGSRWRLARAMVVVMALIGFFGLWAVVVQQWKLRRLFHPVTWFRLVVWPISFAFEMLPLLAVALTTGHHPESLVDPAWYGLWLSGSDATGVSPHWEPPGTTTADRVPALHPDHPRGAADDPAPHEDGLEPSSPTGAQPAVLE